MYKRQEWALTVGALRKRAGITGGTETLPTTVDSYLQRTFYPDVTSPVLLEIRRERAIELVAEGMRFDDLRRWKCGSLMETLRWSGIHTVSYTHLEVGREEDRVGPAL